MEERTRTHTWMEKFLILIIEICGMKKYKWKSNIRNMGK
jgi:hypothetical protein